MLVSQSTSLGYDSGEGADRRSYLVGCWRSKQATHESPARPAEMRRLVAGFAISNLAPSNHMSSNSNDRRRSLDRRKTDLAPEIGSRLRVRI